MWSSFENVIHSRQFLDFSSSKSGLTRNATLKLLTCWNQCTFFVSIAMPLPNLTAVVTISPRHKLRIRVLVLLPTFWFNFRHRFQFDVSNNIKVGVFPSTERENLFGNNCYGSNDNVHQSAMDSHSKCVWLYISSIETFCAWWNSFRFCLRLINRYAFHVEFNFLTRSLFVSCKGTESHKEIYF